LNLMNQKNKKVMLKITSKLSLSQDIVMNPTTANTSEQTTGMKAHTLSWVIDTYTIFLWNKVKMDGGNLMTETKKS